MTEMNPNEFEHTLRELAARPIPAVPSNLAASVLREIRLRRPSSTSPAEALATWLWRRQVAFASVSIAGMMGMVLALSGPMQDSNPAVADALYLHVFSQSSPTLPSTYIDWRR